MRHDVHDAIASARRAAQWAVVACAAVTLVAVVALLAHSARRGGH